MRFVFGGLQHQCLTGWERGHIRARSAMCHVLSLIVFAAIAVPSGVGAMEYAGLCEASAGAFLDNNHFAVASDESNTLRIYERGRREPVGAVDVTAFTGFNKSDLEASAVIGNRLYWISSHSPNSKGKDNPKRQLFFATKIEIANGKPTLVPIGKPVKSLRDQIANAAGVPAKSLNIEALAAAPDGGLLIGLRAPLRNGEALVIPFKNPAKVVDDGVAPEFGKVEPIDIEGRGLRSMDLTQSAVAPYVIVGGPVADSAEPFALFQWSGPGTKPVKITAPELGFRAEGAMPVPGEQLVQLLSDDGDICSDEDTPEVERRFRSVDVKW